MNNFGKAIFSGRAIATAECLPPPGANPAAVDAASAALPAYLDAAVVADNPDRIRCSAFSYSALLRRKSGKSVIMTMAVRDRNRIALLSDALGAAALGVDAILCVSGRHQSTGICPQAAAANDFDSIQLVQALKKIVLYGTAPNGKEIAPRLNLQIGAAAHPFMRPMELSLLRLKKKISVGADFLMTQAVFDLDLFSEWMSAVRESGLDKRTAIIASVLPLASAEQARELAQSRIHGPVGDEIITRLESAANPSEEGALIAAETAQLLADIPGVRGVHFISGGREISIANEPFSAADRVRALRRPRSA